MTVVPAQKSAQPLIAARGLQVPPPARQKADILRPSAGGVVNWAWVEERARERRRRWARARMRMAMMAMMMVI